MGRVLVALLDRGPGSASLRRCGLHPPQRSILVARSRRLRQHIIGRALRHCVVAANTPLSVPSLRSLFRGSSAERIAAHRLADLECRNGITRMDACTSLYPRVESERIMDSSSIRYFAVPGSWAMAERTSSSRVGRKSRRGMGVDDQPKLQRTTDLETLGPLACGHRIPLQRVYTRCRGPANACSPPTAVT